MGEEEEEEDHSAAAADVSAGPTSQDGSDQSRQEAPGVDGHVENGEELLPLATLEGNEREAQETPENTQLE